MTKCVKKGMFDQLNEYKEALENIMSDLEDKDPQSDEAIERLEERMELLQEIIEKFEEVLDMLGEYQDEYRGLGKL